MSWPRVPLEKLTTKIGSGSTPTGGSEAYKVFGIPLIRSMNIHDGEFRADGLAFLDAAQASLLDHVTLAENDVLLNITGASVARACRLPREFVGGRVNQHVAIIRPRLDLLCPEYLEHCLISPSIKNALLKLGGAGATREAITKSGIQEFSIPLPPLPEQRRIAAILDEADELRRMRRASIALVDGFPQALFEQMFGGSRASLAGWQKVTLADVVRHDDQINYGVIQPGAETELGIRLVRVANLVAGDFSPENLKKIDPSIEAQYKRSRLHGDEILVACVGSIGAVALATPELAGANIARAVARIRVNEIKARRTYVSEFLRLASTQLYFVAETRAVAQPTLNIKQLAETPMTLPPLVMQEGFTQRVAEIARLRTRGEINELRSRKQSTNRI